MAQSKVLKSDEFDSLVVGGGIGGLIAAHILEGTGRKVALIEGLDTFGGSCRPINSKVGVLDHGLKFIPDNAEARDVLAWLEGVLGQEIPFESVEAAPLTYDDGKFKPFVGFGDQKVLTAGEVDAYAKDRYLRLLTTPKDWVPALISSFTGTAMPQSYVTKMQVDEEFVIDMLVNGSKRLSGREVIFAAAPQQLVTAKLLPESHVPARLRQRLMKGEFWTSVNLDLIHGSVVTESNSMHILKGANEEPCVGLFSPPQTIDDSRTVQVSQWITLVPRDITDEPELVASALKQIKRQVKRAYPTALDGLMQERIVVNPSSHGDLTGLFGPEGQWPKLQNLWLLSGMMDPAKNLLGSLSQTRRVMSAMVGEPPVEFDLDDSTTRLAPTATA